MRELIKKDIRFLGQGDEDLVLLVKGLTKTEKRYFKLYVGRFGESHKAYMVLYEHISKEGTINKKKLTQSSFNIKQLHNYKHILYKQLLRSLRDMNKEKYIEIKARERFDFAKVLYAKGLYKASLKMLKKVKEISHNIGKESLYYLALSFEKHIESQHVTGSMHARSQTLSTESIETIDDLILTDKLSNLSLKLYGFYLKNGYVRDSKDKQILLEFFTKNLPDYKGRNLNFYQSLYLYQSYLWYYQMILDFPKYYRYAMKWVLLFEEYPQMLNPETTLFIKGWHNVLNAIYLTGNVEKFERAINQLTELYRVKKLELSRNEKSQLELFKNIHLLNGIILHNDYQNGVLKIDALERALSDKEYPWDVNRNIVFYYKIACIYFGAGKYNECINYLNLILDNPIRDLKQDIQCFAHLLNLIVHFELGNEDHLRYKIRSTYRFLLNMKESQRVQKEIILFLRRTTTLAPDVLNSAFQTLKEKLIPLEKDPFEKRPFLYLDIISWLDSRLFKISMKEAIHNRRIAKNKHG